LGTERVRHTSKPVLGVAHRHEKPARWDDPVRDGAKLTLGRVTA